MSALVGADSVDAGDYFDPDLTHRSTTANHSYLFGSLDGPGDDPTQMIGEDLYTSSGGGASDFLSDGTSPDVVFNQLYGSFFSDWHHTNNFLRAAIAGPGYGLASYSAVGSDPRVGAGSWHMGMGETVGDNLLFTQRGQPRAEPVYGTGSFLQTPDRSTALMGDPTLRTAVVKPATNVHVTAGSNSSASISWTPSADQTVMGYRVYRAASMNGPFTNISGTGYLTSGNPFVDPAAYAGCVYMVRAFKTVVGNTGSYLNVSQGASRSNSMTRRTTFRCCRAKSRLPAQRRHSTSRTILTCSSNWLAISTAMPAWGSMTT